MWAKFPLLRQFMRAGADQSAFQLCTIKEKYDQWINTVRVAILYVQVT